MLHNLPDFPDREGLIVTLLEPYCDDIHWVFALPTADGSDEEPELFALPAENFVVPPDEASGIGTNTRNAEVARPRAKSRAEDLEDQLYSVERAAETAEADARTMLNDVARETAEAESLPAGDTYKKHLLRQARLNKRKADAKQHEAEALIEVSQPISPRATEADDDNATSLLPVPSVAK